ncbi:MAG: hypothetical protein EA425_00400 [Puniceicoccaceae bacterium]|nr:MAG: hypothetical protein EA425_00400 [Puniceicoccaceae bacterium]
MSRRIGCCTAIMPPIPDFILDTDIDTDCDDAGALAVVHALAKQGRINVLGVICSVPLPECAACVHAINQWHGRSDLPVGLVRIPDWRTAPAHQAYLAHRADLTKNGTQPLYNELVSRPTFGENPPPAEDAVSLYRRLLAAADDGSVTICAIGTLSALALLLASGPDEHSPLKGVELVRQKGARLVTMAVSAPPEGREAFNWRMDLPAAAAVVRDWPTPIHVSRHGSRVLAGPGFLARTTPANPVHLAYRSFLDLLGHPSRPSWDHLAVLCAAGCADSWFQPEGGFRIVLDPASGRYQWIQDKSGPDRAFLRPTAGLDDADLSAAVESLMIEADPQRIDSEQNDV